MNVLKTENHVDCAWFLPVPLTVLPVGKLKDCTVPFGDVKYWRHPGGPALSSSPHLYWVALMVQDRVAVVSLAMLKVIVLQSSESI